MVTVAQAVASFLVGRGVERVYGLPGGHIQPIWEALADAGVRIVHTRHEGGAGFMAQAESQLGGVPGVALVTAGPGFTNTMTAMANADVAGLPLVVLSGRPPRQQWGMGALQDVAQNTVASSFCRSSETVVHSRRLLAALDQAFSAAMGDRGSPGPTYVDLPLDVMRAELDPADLEIGHFAPPAPNQMAPDPTRVATAAAVLRGARRPLVLGGSGLGPDDADALSQLLEVTGALYLDSAESRSLVPRHHPASVPAARADALAGADAIVTLGRRLDFQLAYGSSAVFSPDVRFIRLGRSWEEVSGGRAATAALIGHLGTGLRALVAADVAPKEPDVDWLNAVRDKHRSRAERFESDLASAAAAPDGAIHPYAVMHAVNEVTDDETIAVIDGGDTLSFARIALAARHVLDPGPFGCIGVGVPYAVAAALARPDRRVVCVTGDGSFGFHAMEVATAAVHEAGALFVVMNNGAWNIDRYDQRTNYEHVVGVELGECRYDVLAQGLGAHGVRVTEAADLPAAIEEALAHLPAVVDVVVSGEVVSPDARSGLAGAPDWQAVETWDRAERSRRT